MQLSTSKLKSMNFSFIEILDSPRFSKMIMMMFIILIVIMVVNFSWKLWESFQPPDVIVISQTGHQQKSPVFNTRKLKSFDLFGSVQSEQVAQQNSQNQCTDYAIKTKT